MNSSATWKCTAKQIIALLYPVVGMPHTCCLRTNHLARRRTSDFRACYRLPIRLFPCGQPYPDKEGGKFRFKRFSISGTGGQCLLSPPDKPYEQMPYFWYNAGGVLMNLLPGIIALIL
ncbi:MAG: hypothetical protein ACLSCE_16590 [Bacteroides cellulosilyticus]